MTSTECRCCRRVTAHTNSHRHEQSTLCMIWQCAAENRKTFGAEFDVGWARAPHPPTFPAPRLAGRRCRRKRMQWIALSKLHWPSMLAGWAAASVEITVSSPKPRGTDTSAAAAALPFPFVCCGGTKTLLPPHGVLLHRGIPPLV